MTHKENLENMGAHIDAVIGVRGVSMGKRGKYQVRVVHNGKVHSGGQHATVDEAERAAIALRNRLYSNSLLDRG